MDGNFSLEMGGPSGELLEFHATAGSWMGQRLSVTAAVCLLWLSLCRGRPAQSLPGGTAPLSPSCFSLGDGRAPGGRRARGCLVLACRGG